MIGSLITFFAVGLVALVAISVILAVVGTVFSLALGLVSFLLFKVGPFLLLGWLVLKVLERVRRPKALSPSDVEWLEGDR
jgi:predicted membrane channel-forming protein YqfA (hemolysin III family)